MTCFICLEQHELMSPCELCKLHCHSICLSRYVSKTGLASCPLCGVRFKENAMLDSLYAHLLESEQELGASHEDTLASALDTAIVCARLGRSEEACHLFERVKRCCAGGWLSRACRIECSRIIMKSKPRQAIQELHKLAVEFDVQEYIPLVFIRNFYFVLASAYFANGNVQKAKLIFQRGFMIEHVSDIPLRDSLPFLQGIARCAEATHDVIECMHYRYRIYSVVESFSKDICTIATARIEYAISLKKCGHCIPRKLRIELRDSVKSLRQRRRDRTCSQLLLPVCAAMYWLKKVKRRIRKKSHAEDALDT